MNMNKTAHAILAQAIADVVHALSVVNSNHSTNTIANGATPHHLVGHAIIPPWDANNTSSHAYVVSLLQQLVTTVQSQLVTGLVQDDTPSTPPPPLPPPSEPMPPPPPPPGPPAPLVEALEFTDVLLAAAPLVIPLLISLVLSLRMHGRLIVAALRYVGDCVDCWLGTLLLT